MVLKKKVKNSIVTSRGDKKLTAFSHNDVPMWENASFQDMFMDIFSSTDFEEDLENINNKTKSVGSDPSMSINLLVDVFESLLDNRQDWLLYYEKQEKQVFMTYIQMLEEVNILLSKIQEGSDSIDNLYEVTNYVTSQINQMSIDDKVLLPVSYGIDSKGKEYSFHHFYLLVEHCGNSFSMFICNTGPGVEYHPFKPRSETHNPAEMKFKYSIGVFEIPLKRLKDSWFWFSIYRMCVFKLKIGTGTGPKFFYETLIPYLNDKRLSCLLKENKYDEDDEKVGKDSSMWGLYRAGPPNNNDTSLVHCTLESFRVCMRRGNLPVGASEHLTALACWELSMMMMNDLDVVDKDTLEASRVRQLKSVIEQVLTLVVNVTNSYGIFSCTELYELENHYDKVNERLSQILVDLQPDSVPPIPPDFIREGLQVEFVPFSLFDKLLRTSNVDDLAGVLDTPQVPQPADFTTIPNQVETIDEICSALSRCVDLLNLFAYQKDVAHSYALRIALVQYMFDTLIPIPLPDDHPQVSICIWRQAMLRSTQVEILRLLDVISFTFNSTSMSICHERAFEGRRSLVLSAIVCCADVTLRCIAIDSPSAVSLHITGKCAKTISFNSQPFGIDVTTFAVQSQYMKFLEPAQVLVRTKVLDYFYSINSTIDDDHQLFLFEESMSPQRGEVLLMKQLVWEIRFPRPLEEELYPKYITGDYPEMIAAYPELSYYRDIVFTFKFLSSSINDSFPDIKDWFPLDAKLVWKYKLDKGYSVTAFEKSLRCYADVIDENNEENKVKHLGMITPKQNIFKSLFSSNVKSLSGADPSTLVGRPILSEEDVLHVRDLPDFDGTLNQRDSELLISFLTVPYLRIPLLLNFFADVGRFPALGSIAIQEVLDSAMFEPGIFQPDDRHVELILPETIPAKTREHLSTPGGLLFNELIHSSTGVLDCLVSLLNLALDRDTGRYTESTGPSILYVVRLIVRVQSFLEIMIRNSQDTTTRGFPTKGDVLLVNLIEKRKEFRHLLNSRIFVLLDGWMEYAVKKDHTTQACIIQMHILYLYKYTPFDEFDTQVVISLISGLLFVNSQHQFSIRVKKGSFMRRNKKKKISSGLQGFEDMDVFDILTRQRYNILLWLKVHEDMLSGIMETIVRMITINSTMFTSGASLGASRSWVVMSGYNCYGRFIPCTSSDGEGHGERCEEEAEIEVNLQVGSLTLKSNLLRPLDQHVYEFVDFKSVFGSVEEIKCADIEKRDNRHWMRLVGRRHDVQVWNIPKGYSYKVEYSRPFVLDTAARRERWIVEALVPYIDKVEELQGLEFYIPISKQMENKAAWASLLGVNKVENIVRQVIIYSLNHVIQVFNIVEYGRRWYRSLVFSSDSSWSYDTLENIDSRLRLPGSTSTGECVGIDSKVVDVESLVITRNLGDSIDDEQYYIPSRLVKGLLPSSLLDRYELWQSTDDSITGYPRELDGSTRRFLRIEFLKVENVQVDITSDEDADDVLAVFHDGVPVRVYTYPEDKEASRNKLEDIQSNPLFLLNLLGAPGNTRVSELAEFLVQIEDLAHVLVWTRTDVYYPYEECSIDLVQFPRLGISFYSEIDEYGVKRLYSNEHEGMFISWVESKRFLKVVSGIPQALVLQNHQGSTGVIVPVNMPKVVNPYKHHENEWDYNKTMLKFFRNDDNWRRNLTCCQFYYPIHITKEFLFTSTLSSSIYMLVLGFINREYEQVMRLADSCVSDSIMSNEELQVFTLLSMTDGDCHPDAHACRLKLLMIEYTHACRMWSIEKELYEYVRKRGMVSASCRFTVKEENDILNLCGVSKYHEIENRRVMLVAMLSGVEVMRVVSLPEKVRLEDEFDSVVDKKAIEDVEGNIEKELKKVSKMAYSPLEEGVEGVEVCRMLHCWMKNGFSIKGTRNQKGFLFFYDLLTGNVIVRICTSDSSFNLGCLLVRMIRREDMVKGYNMSVLRILMYNPDLAMHEDIPKLDKKLVRKGWRQRTFIASSDASFMKLMMYLLEWLRGHAVEMYFPEDEDEDDDEDEDNELELPSLESLPRAWISARVSSYSRDKAPLRVIDKDMFDTELTSKEVDAFSSIPCGILGLNDYLEEKVEDKRSRRFPLELDTHPQVQTELGSRTIKRLKDDFNVFNNDKNKEYQIKYIKDRNKCFKVLTRLFSKLDEYIEYDSRKMSIGIENVVKTANWVGYDVPEDMLLEQDDVVLKSQLCFNLLRKGRQETFIGFRYLVSSLLSWEGDLDIERLNPYLGEGSAQLVQDKMTSIMLHTNRLTQLILLRHETRGLMNSITSECEDVVIYRQGLALARSLMCERCYVYQGRIEDLEYNGLVYDPRYLVFEFSQSLLLRKSQIDMIGKMMDSVYDEDQEGMCQQMIMGAGKTTVVGPLLALMVSEAYEDGKEGITMQIVPRSLLEFSRGVMRDRFSSIILKSVYTFSFDRFQNVSEDLMKKMMNAAKNRAVMISYPTAVKAFALKYIELLDGIDSKDVDEDVKKEVMYCTRILKLFKDGVLIIDEVDTVLHPLKSELNFPIGYKEDLDFSRCSLGSGLRWEVVFKVLDPILYTTSGSMSMNMLHESKEATELVTSICNVVQDGITRKCIQTIPHLVLLDVGFYTTELLPKLAKWMLFWLDSFPHASLSESVILGYLLEDREYVLEDIDDDFIKLLNLCRDWIQRYLPFILGKIDRVTFGILSQEDLQDALCRDPKMPNSRKVTAVPFIGKDVPSQSSEFAHPDIVIGLTILGFRYEGLRKVDLTKLLYSLQRELMNEDGVIHKRPSSLLYNKWVREAGGHVRGTSRIENVEFEIWPLHLLELDDDDQFLMTWKLLRHVPHLVHYYTCNFVFPIVMKRQSLKLSASGQSLGGKMLFNKRIGFSGTPSELLPVEFGKCHYEQGSDGRILSYLTDKSICRLCICKEDWSIRGLLDRVAKGGLHALIDTGALITGLSNQEVAEYLLDVGLEDMDGVVFLDKKDRKMVMIRTKEIIGLDECGIDKNKRFTFYDQIHTTGMDIIQPLVCNALMTLGKDMTFRDYAQGAFRMRGIGKGQCIEVFVTSEVRELVRGKEEEIGLEDICSWLVINGIKSEKSQYLMLAQQNLANIWRKNAFDMLKKRYEDVGRKMDKILQVAIDVFRERIDYSIENTVKVKSTLVEECKERVRMFQEMIKDEDRMLIEKIIKEIIKEDIVYEHNEYDAVQLQEDEQEAEQEQEQEQLQEEQVEQHEYEEEAYVVKKKWITNSQQDVYWNLDELFNKNISNHKAFYPLSDFRLYTDKSSDEFKEFKFSNNLLLSVNFYSKSSYGHRRLKNRVILLDWIPCLDDVKEVYMHEVRNKQGKELADSSLAHIQRAFTMFDTSGKDELGYEEFICVLKALDINVNINIPLQEYIGKPVVFPMRFNEFRQVVLTQHYHRMHTNRYYVGISLDEAESLRALLHTWKGKHVLEKSSISLLYGEHVLDSSNNKFPSFEYQRYSALQTFRYFDCDYQFSERGLGAVLRGVQENSVDARKEFYMSVKKCRRRVLKVWEDTPLYPILKIDDEYGLFEFRCIISCIRLLLRRRGLGVFDAFRMFDVYRNGMIYCSELYGALEWLGLRLLAEDVYAIVRYVDSTGEGRIRYSDFCKAFCDPKVDVMSSFGSNDEVSVIKIHSIKELYQEKEKEEKEEIIELEEHVLDKLKVKMKPCKYYKFQWNSHGTKARKPVSIWAPDTDKLSKLKRNKTRVCLGHYCVAQISKGKKTKVPASLKSNRVMELTDQTSTRLKKSKNLTVGHVNHLLPYPNKMKRVWSKTGGDLPLFVWRGVAPSGFYCLGMVTTNTDEPPSVECIRCVPKAWTRVVDVEPEFVWDDTGTGGRRGSFWKVNSLNLLWVTNGHDPPEGPFYDLVADRLLAGDGKLVQKQTSLILPAQENSDSEVSILDEQPINLPHGWSRVDEGDGVYFYHQATGAASWDVPTGDPILDPAWIVQLDPESGETFYFNKETGESSWDWPQ